ncbi:bifunctional precorrin-2 dehydrogenase/sirohydrochlorin ferrochelatase [Chloroflexota bacterium]
MKNDTSGTIYYPVSLNIRGRMCAVVGGGQVALRKVKALLEHGADVKVISPDFCPELAGLAERGEIRALTREYQPGDLKDAFVAIVATDNSEINQQIAVEARRKAVLVNVVDDAENSDFIAPSYLRRGEVTISISTSGESPALARKIRTRLEKEFGNEYAGLASLIGRVRAEAREQKIKVDGDGWQEAIDLDLLLGLLRRGEEEKARTTLLSNIKAKQRLA